MGFCFGGGLAWRPVTEASDLSAAAPFYGPSPPLEAVGAIKAAVFGVYAEHDPMINESVPDLRHALDAAKTRYAMEVYPGASHRFHSHHNPERYHPEAARAAWRDALAWFERHLKSGT